LAAILIYATMSLAVSGALIMGILMTYLNPDFYRTDFFKEVIYQEIIDQIIDTVQTEIPEANHTLDRETLKEQLSNLLPPEILGNTLSDLFAQFQGNKLPENITVSLVPIKERIPEAIQALMPQIGQNLPPEISSDQLARELQKNVVEQLPDEISVPLNTLEARLNDHQKATLLYVLTKGRTQFPALLMGAIAILMVFIVLLAGKPWKKASFWIGATLLLDGIFVLAGMYSLNKLGTPLLENMKINPEFITPVTDTMQSFGGWLTLGGAIGFIIGMLFIYQQHHERT